MFHQSADPLFLINILVIRYFFLNQLIDDLHAKKFYRRLVIGHEVISGHVGTAVVRYPLHHVLQSRI